MKKMISRRNFLKAAGVSAAASAISTATAGVSTATSGISTAACVRCRFRVWFLVRIVL